MRHDVIRRILAYIPTLADVIGIVTNDLETMWITAKGNEPFSLASHEESICPFQEPGTGTKRSDTAS